MISVLVYVSVIIPQLSKCLKSDVTRGIRLTKGLVFEKSDIIRPVPVLLIREWHTIINLR